MNTRLLRFASRAWPYLAGAVVLAAVAAWSLGGCGPRVAPGELAYLPGEPVPPDAATATVERRTIRPRLDVVGTVASGEIIHLSARLGAYVREVAVNAGDSVSAGQVLIALDDRELQEQLASAEAQLQQAGAEFERATRLLEQAATTQQAYDAADAAFRSARAQVDRTRVMLTDTIIRSPIDGVVTDRRAEVGDLAGPGQLLLGVYDPLNMRLEAAVPVRLLDHVGIGQELEVTLDFPAGVFTGRVTEVVGEIDPASRTRQVRIRLAADRRDILPGTFGRAWLAGSPREALLLPPACLYRVGQLDFVSLVRDGRAVQRLVTLGPRHGDSIEVLSGLRAGDRVLVAPRQED